MILAGSTDPWLWSEDVDVAVDFCVQALRHDGLRVPPFDRHPDGDGSLRDLGLDPGSWRRWLDAVLRQLELLDAHLRQPELRAHRRAVANIGRPLGRPGGLCPGSRELRARLDELWTGHAPVADAWKRAMTERPRHALLPPTQARWLWLALEPFHARLPTLRVYLVDYPERVAMTVPPTTVLVARDPADQDGSAYARTLAAAAAELASSGAPPPVPPPTPQ